MTQHIDEAIVRLKQLRKVGFGYDIKDEDRAAIDAVLFALAAAEERGRMAEQERIRAWLLEQRKEIPAHGWEFANAIAKEPTHTNPQRNDYTERYDGID